MTTPYSDIFDLFTMLTKDYRLDALYSTSLEDFEAYLTGWLVFAVRDFSDICDQSLVRNDTTNLFTETLTDTNKVLLAELMVKYWLDQSVQDILQMNLHLQDRDFKTFAESQNLREKSAHLDKIKETLSQKMLSYAYAGNDWTEWFVGNFTGA